MARTSNFSMSLRGRKPTEKQVPCTNMEHTRDSLANMEPFFARSAKAEKILGPLELFDNGLRTGPKSPKLQKKKNRATTMPKSNCIVDTGHGREVDRPRTQASSPVIGCARCDRCRMGTDAFLHSSRSCWTLQSHCDPVVSPLFVSQQTSDSSCRDMALRKVCPRMSCILPQDTPLMSHLNAINDPGDSRIGTKRRPPKLDFSSLFPRSHPTNGALLSLEQDLRSPPKMSSVPDGQQTPTSKYRRWLSRRGDRSSYLPNNNDKFEPKNPTTRRHVPAFPDSPKNQTQAGDYAETPTSQESLQPSSSSSVRTLTSQLSLDGVMSRSHSQQLLMREMNQQIEMSANDPSHFCDSPMFYSDLHIQSVLALSSSEDEDDDDDDFVKTFQHPSLDGKQVLSTVQSSRYRSSVPLDSTQYMHNDENNAMARSSTLPSWTMKSTSDTLTNNSHDLRSNSGPISLDSSRTKELDGIQPEEISSTESSFHQHAVQPRRMNRFMAVTRDEETLLEAMRQKRASMRHTVLIDGKDGAGSRRTNNRSLSRPRTADPSRRSSKYFKMEMSNFPAPPKSTEIINFSWGNDLEEDVSKLPDFRSIDDWPLPALRHSFLSMSKGTSESSPVFFDALPSPMTNRSSPLTPPPDQITPSFSTIGLATSPGQASYKEKTRFQEKGEQDDETMMFDFFGQTQEEQEENDLVQWADGIYS